MAELLYTKGDATDPIGTRPAVIAHVVNNIGVWGGGFTASIDARWPAARSDYVDWIRERSLTLGDVRYCALEPGSLVLAHMAAQSGIRSIHNPRPIRYAALEKCLVNVCAVASYPAPIPVHMPRIGCGLAGGSWDEVEPLIQRYAVDRGITVYVYDLDPVTQDG